MLTDAAIKSLDLEPGKTQRKAFDTGGVQGLYFLISPGSKGWRFRYYLNGRERLMSLGVWPAVSLAQARSKAETLRKQLEAGVDPAEQRKVDTATRVETREQTFGRVGTEMLAQDDIKASRTKRKHEWLFGLLRSLHARPITELKTPDLVKVLRAIQDSGDRRETAHRASMLIGRIFRYAVQSGYIENNPATSLRGALKPIKVESHAAVTDPKQLAKLLALIWSYDLIGHATVCAALKMIAYTFARPGEIRTAEWSEIDLDKGEWLLPPARMKMRRAHMVPLATQVVELLREQQLLTGGGRYIFPGRNNVHMPLSDGALGKGLKMIYFMSDMHTAHGFRATASTLLNGELHYDSAIIELQLAHQKSDKVAAIYDRASRLPERRAMMQKYADYLDSLRASHGKEKQQDVSS